jgi:hypothetical protein
VDEKPAAPDKAAVREKKVASIVWRQYSPKEIEIGYHDGAAESIPGTYSEAAQLAGETGMRRVPSPLGSVRWEEGLPTKDGRRPKRIGPWLTP